MLQVTLAYSKISVATVTAVAAALGFVNAPLEQQKTPIKALVAQVQLQAAVTQIVALASTDSAAIPSSADVVASATTPRANETTDPFLPVRQLLTIVLAPVGLVIAPFWWLGAPITIPLWSAIRGNPYYGNAGWIGFLEWLAAPFVLPMVLFPTSSANTAAANTTVQGRAGASARSISVDAQSSTAAEPASTSLEKSKPKITTVAQAQSAVSARKAVTPLAAIRGALPADAKLAADSAPVQMTASTPRRAASATRRAEENGRSTAQSPGADFDNNG